MGTRSNTIVFDRDQKLVNVYRQMDGYPSGHGAELAEFLADMHLCNGIGEIPKGEKWANGAGCLAAQLVASLKDEIGRIYLTKLDEDDNDYTYEIHMNTMAPKDGMRIVCRSEKEIHFTGNPAEFSKFCAAA